MNDKALAASDFGVGGSIPGGHKEHVNVTTGQVGMLGAMFTGRTIVWAGPDPQRLRGLILKFSDGSTVGIKTSVSPKNIELSYDIPVPGKSTQPRRFIVATG